MERERVHLVGGSSDGQTSPGTPDSLHYNSIDINTNVLKYPNMDGSCLQKTTDTDELLIDDGVSVDSDSNVDEKGKITSSQAFIHIVRCHAGSGLLGAAKAVNNAGLWVGMVLFLVSGLLVLSGMHLILGSARHLGHRLSVNTDTWNYQEIVEQSFLHGHIRFRKFAGFARSCAVIFSALLQFGVCSFFFVVVGDDIHQLVLHYTQVALNIRLYMLLMMVLMIAPALIKRLDILAVFSAIANVLFFTTLLVIFGYIFVDLPPIDTRPAFNSWDKIPLFFGQALLTLEGIAVIVPVQNKMKEPEKFANWFGVLNIGLGAVILIVTLLGFLGNLKYGAATETNILLNLPPDEWLSVIAKVMLPLAIMLTYPIQFYFIFVMIWPPWKERITSPWLLQNGEYIQRLIVLLLSFGCAAFVPHLDLLMALFGAVCCTFLGFVIPASTDFVLHVSSASPLRLIRDVIFILLGLIFFVTGTYFSMIDIVATF